MKVLFWMFIGFDKHATSEHLLTAVIEQLCKAGHSVHILQKHTGGCLPSIPDCLTNYPITTDAFPVQSVNRKNFAARYLSELKYINQCKTCIKSGYDAVFIQSTTVMGFAVKAIRKKCPHAIVTINVQDIFPYNIMYCGKLKANGMKFKALATAQRYGYKHSDHIITISEDMKETLVEDGTDPNKIEVIYNWSYQDELYENVDLTSVSHLFNRDYFNVVYAGNIGVMQNVDLLVETANLMKNDKNIWFHIIGAGVCKEKLEVKAKENKIRNISFLPMQPPKLAPAIYTSADVNVIPLVENAVRTALPSKTATCLACQKPIILAIGKDSIIGKKMRKEAHCLVINSNSAEEMKNAIQEIMKRGRSASNMSMFFQENCNKTHNSKLYAEIIVRG